jgi:hypothetical protein
MMFSVSAVKTGIPIISSVPKAQTDSRERRDFFRLIKKGLNSEKINLKDQVNRNVPLTGYPEQYNPAALIRIFLSLL